MTLMALMARWPAANEFTHSTWKCATPTRRLFHPDLAISDYRRTVIHSSWGASRRYCKSFKALITHCHYLGAFHYTTLSSIFNPMVDEGVTLRTTRVMLRVYCSTTRCRAAAGGIRPAIEGVVGLKRTPTGNR
jgi:hypothetical protein